MSSAEVLLEITAALQQAGIPYMVVGSFASNLYGTGRATHDIDFVISATPEQTRMLLSLLPTAKYYFDFNTALEACRRKDMFNILDMERGWKIDLIFEKPSRYHQEAFQRRSAAEIEHVAVFAATAEDTIITKLEWAKMGESTRQIEDVAGILKVQTTLLDRSYIEKWVRELGLDSQWKHACRIARLE
jgi:isopropylmalate/homocitrate/citramalate synthase